MKVYYYERDGVTSAPLSLKELKAANITPNTMVWFDGLGDWTPAGHVDELASLFRQMPPPVTKRTSPPPRQNRSRKPQSRGFLATVRGKIFVSLAVVAIAMVIISFRDNGTDDTIIANRQNTNLLEQQQKQLDEQNAKLAEQERLEKERQERERKAEIEQQIQDVSVELAAAKVSLETENRNVNEVSGFKVFRSRSTRNQEISEANNKLEVSRAVVNRLERQLADLQAQY